MVRKLKNFGHLLKAFLAVCFYRFPAFGLTVIGVTGTDGKTTTVHLIGEILKKGGFKVAMVSSVAAYLGEKEIETGFHVTTPDSWSLQKLLRQIKDWGLTHVVLETTSHGFDQHRLLGCHFQIGVVTNVTHEHLDYHQSYENYLKAKAKLFRRAKVAVLNRDDQSYSYFISHITYRPVQIITYGIKNKADFTPKSFSFKTKLPGEYNLYNCLAAIAATRTLGVREKIIKEVVADFPGVIGRMEKIDEGQGFSVFIDFAHTPNALENVLTVLQKAKSKKGKLIVVFGCAGERDREKRPMMGEIAPKLADFTVLTAEDPRTEDVGEIIDQIASGCLRGGAKELDPSSYHISYITYPCFFRIPDRSQAIKYAIQKLARKQDIVVICGKGHEKSMCFGKTEYPWSDQEAARQALK